MEGLDQLGTIFGSGGGGGGTPASPAWQSGLLGALFGGGEISNILESIKQQKYQNKLLSLINNPAELTKMILSAERPLDNSLVQTVNNRVQGDMASRGLSQAPGIFAASESQALAPFVQQNYGNAEQQVLASLGLPAGTFTAPQNMTPALQAFLKSFGTPGGGGGSSTSSPGLALPFDMSSLVI